MKQLFLISSLCIFFAGCSTFELGGSASTSATYVSKGESVKATSKSTTQSTTQSEIDMKVQELKRENDSRIINRYIRNGF